VVVCCDVSTSQQQPDLAAWRRRLRRNPPAPSEGGANGIGGRRQWNRRHLLDELHQIRNPKFDSRNDGVAVERSIIFLAKIKNFHVGIQ